MARLVSGYYQKFVKLAKHGTWAPKIRLIIEKYRARPNSGDPVRPSPEEVVRYVLDRLRDNKRQTDPHWRPQHLQCPFCLVNFTIYAKGVLEFFLLILSDQKRRYQVEHIF